MSAPVVNINGIKYRGSNKKTYKPGPIDLMTSHTTSNAELYTTQYIRVKICVTQRCIQTCTLIKSHTTFLISLIIFYYKLILKLILRYFKQISTSLHSKTTAKLCIKTLIIDHNNGHL
jgi:hypothetical protein